MISDFYFSFVSFATAEVYLMEFKGITKIAKAHPFLPSEYYNSLVAQVSGLKDPRIHMCYCRHKAA